MEVFCGSGPAVQARESMHSIRPGLTAILSSLVGGGYPGLSL
jgi:hypothetical protein